MWKPHPNLVIQPGQIYQTKCQDKNRTSSLQWHNFLRINKMCNTFITSSISNIINKVKVIVRKTNFRDILHIVETMKIIC